jgi:LPS-assembly protein
LTGVTSQLNRARRLFSPHQSPRQGEDGSAMYRTAHAIGALPVKTRTVRFAALLGAALVAALAPAAMAKPRPSTAASKSNTPVKAAPDDGLGTRDVYLEADNLIDDRDSNTVTGEGHVEIRYQGRTLRADKVIYNSVTGAAHAIGHIVITSADGNVEYANEAELDDQFRAGVALGFSARMQDNVTIVAAAAAHRNEMVNTLRNGRYTPCDICRADGSPKEPTFSIEAQTIVEDREHQIIYYRHAVIRVKGVPVLALPVFWHADPTAKRRSGFLTPKIEFSGRRGLSYEQPYLFALTPSSELIIDPQLNTSVNPLLNLRYRQQFYSGLLDIRTGYTDEKLFDSHGKFGADTNRSYILAKGAWQLDPRFTIGFGAERVTDPTFFRRYSIPQVFQDRGPYKTDTDRLISQLYVTRQDSQSYISIAGLSYESLRASVTNQTVQRYDTSSAFPVVGPLIEARYDPRDPVFGGRLRALASAVVLSRSNTVIAVTDPSGINPAGPQPFGPTVIPGVNGAPATIIPPVRPTNAQSLTYTDSTRATTEIDWRRDITFENGLRLSPFAEARGDIYSIGTGGYLTSGLNYSTVAAAKGTTTRGTGTLGVDASWPFIRPIGAGSLILEPLAQLALSPRVRPNANIPNEDSASFEFDETTLFSTHRFPGYDLYEGGQRVNIGGRATADFGGGRSASLLIGRVFRSERDLVFSAVSGLQGTSSDWITAVSITPIPGLTLFNRARLDADSWKVHREEAGVNLSIGRSNLSARYRYDENGVLQVQCGFTTCTSPFGGTVANGATVVGKVENAEFSGSTYITKHWGVSANATRDLQTRIWPVAQLGVFYQDECLRFDILYTHDETYSSVIGSSNAVTFRLTLTTLGASVAPGTRAYDSR